MSIASFIVNVKEKILHIYLCNIFLISKRKVSNVINEKIIEAL